MNRNFLAYSFVLLLILGLALIRLLGGSPALDLSGLISGNELEQVIMVHFRGPRLLLALLTGAALGMAGSISQIMLRNPLASPDIIGFSAGASAGAAAAILIFGDIAAATFGALAGGVLAATLVMTLAWRDGLSPLALVLIGVSLNLMLLTGTDILLSLSPSILATELTRYLTGSFASADWQSVTLIASATVVCGAILAFFSLSVDRLESGDDLAISLGLKPNQIRFCTTACMAVLVAIAVAVAGPIPFVAFLAGPIARMITGQPGSNLGLAALIGATLAVSADILAGIPIDGTRLPAGVFTALIGAPAMLLLLMKLEGDRK